VPPPLSDEIEISIFGRGSGEAIVVHLGGGKWLLIDSLNGENGLPVSIDYLRALNVPADAVDAILLTHWHDDHIAGAGLLVNEYDAAIVAIPAALQGDEFLGFIENSQPASTKVFSSGIAELQLVFSKLRQRGTNPHWSMAQRRISGGPADPYEFEALSPSNAEITEFLNSIKGWLTTQAVGGRLAAPKRNETSVASVLKVNNELFLFGADLEVGSLLTGWDAVFLSSWLNRGQACFVKIPHHGSKNAHFEKMWTEMARKDVFAALTPWNKNQGLPTRADITRINKITTNAYAASRPLARKALKRLTSVDNLLRTNGIEITRKNDGIGHLRFRMRPSISLTWQVEVHGVGAAHLTDLAA